MDVLSDALAAMRTGRPRSVRTEASAPWGLRFQPVVGASFHVVLQGTCWLIPAQRAPIPLAPGDVVFLRSGRGHGLADSPATPLASFQPEQAGTASPIGRLRIPGPGPRTVLLCGAYQLDQTRPHPLLRDLPEILHLPARLGRRTDLQAAVELLGAELEGARPGADAIVPALVDALLLYILRSWLESRSQEAAGGWAAALADPAVAAALRSMHRDPARPWTVGELGAQAGLSRAPFARRFTALVGEPPLTYLTRWRMALAGRLLRETDLPLAAVAERVGYASEFAFARAFKRAYGTAPGQYRRQQAGRQRA